MHRNKFVASNLAVLFETEEYINMHIKLGSFFYYY